MLLERLLKLWQETCKIGFPKDGVDRRKFIRIVYPPSTRPRLKVKEHELEVLDISEEGMRILNYRQIKIRGKIFGTVFFSSGKSKELTGKIVWQHENEIGLFITHISRSTLLDEVRALLRKMSNKTDEDPSY